jgi:hypothetical protein
LYRHFDTKKNIYIAILEGDEKLPHPEEIATTDNGKQRIEHLIDLAQTQPDRFACYFDMQRGSQSFVNTLNKGLLNASPISPLEAHITGNKKRKFAALLLRDTVMSMLLTWADCGYPNPEIMPDLIGNAIASIVSSIENS